MQVLREKLISNIGFAFSVIGILGVSLASFSDLSFWVLPIALVLALMSIPGMLLRRCFEIA